jgi:polyketide biosynthesis enoyl-CoA hydratase PksI
MTGTLVLLREEPPVAVIRLVDEAGRNRISVGLRSGLIAALRRAAANEANRAIVLAGLPEMFCAGAPAERMLGGRTGRVEEMWELVRSVLECPIPVVAAAQGHAFGGGLLLALYADVTVLSERSRYSANFARYGFTPILGATYLLPAMLGRALGTEMLYTGANYSGRALADRGAGVRVCQHDTVRAVAEQAARDLACAPRQTVELLKRQLRAPVRRAALRALRREAADHEATIATAHARARIRELSR